MCSITNSSTLSRIHTIRSSIIRYKCTYTAIISIISSIKRETRNVRATIIFYITSD